MAEAPIRMNGQVGVGSGLAADRGGEEDPQTRAVRLEREAEAIRQHLDDLLGELDRRRHAASDFGKQVGRYLVPAGIAVVAVAATVWGVSAYRRRHRRTQVQLLLAQAGILSRRLGQAVDPRPLRGYLGW